ncbi:MAG: hypothetical protein ACREUT_21585 [Steroidobacteraceae bacterium]
MRTKVLRGTARDRAALALTTGALLALAAGGCTRAAAGEPFRLRLPVHFSGLLNDYSATMVNNAPISGSPYEMHGKWTLDLNEARRTATFAAELSMETADFANPDAKTHDPTQLKPHTHHILVTDGVIHDDPTGDPVNWASSCPSTFSPPIKGGFVVTGSAYVTGNGANAPFGNPTPVTICVLGGVSTGVANTASVTYSNLTLTFAPAPQPPAMNAASHFGDQAINGVVENCEGGPGLFLLLPSSACTAYVVPE